jgi:hypothetical protein
VLESAIVRQNSSHNKFTDEVIISSIEIVLCWSGNFLVRMKPDRRFQAAIDMADEIQIGFLSDFHFAELWRSGYTFC